MSLYSRDHTEADFFRAANYFYRIGSDDAARFLMRRMDWAEEVSFMLRCGIESDELLEKGRPAVADKQRRRMIIWAKDHDVEPIW